MTHSQVLSMFLGNIAVIIDFSEKFGSRLVLFEVVFSLFYSFNLETICPENHFVAFLKRNVLIATEKKCSHSQKGNTL